MANSPGLAAVLSFVYTGVGQIYNGQILKGVILVCIQSVLLALSWLLIPLIPWAIIWLWGMYDAYSVAVAKNRRGLP
jgi:TM2 domain-containing membrane protein YozV